MIVRRGKRVSTEPFSHNREDVFMFDRHLKSLVAFASLSFFVASPCPGAGVSADSVAAPVVFEARVKASNAKWYAGFGRAAAVSGNTMVIGTPSVGAGYVFVRDGTNWIQQVYLKASNTGYVGFA